MTAFRNAMQLSGKTMFMRRSLLFTALATTLFFIMFTLYRAAWMRHNMTMALELREGAVEIVIFRHPGSIYMSPGFHFQAWRHPVRLWFDWHSSSALLSIVIPGWIPVVAVLLLRQTLVFFKAQHLRKTNFCTQCKYNLSGLTNNKCPECGQDGGQQ